ncbi:MAG: ABC transporter permease [Spirochaetaceae bacterium]|nr:ABC transporter permease [Spirochaetaceae bacterium]
MPVLWRIAFRNIWEHKAKSFIIGSLIVLGVVVIVLGNSLIDSSQAGIRKSFIESFTGDVMVHGPSESAVSIFGLESADGEMEVPTIPSYEKVLETVKAEPGVAAATSMAVAYGSLALDAEELPDTGDEPQGNGPPGTFAIVNGVDPATYFTMFPSIKIEEGRYLETGETGILLKRDQLESLGKRYGKTLKVGDKILINGFGTAGFKIREVAVVGLYKRDPDEGGPPATVYVDIDTARVLGGLTLGAEEVANLDPSQTALLASDDMDALFGEDIVDAAPAAKSVDFSKVTGLLGDTTKRESLNKADTGAWHFILVRLKNSNAAPAFIKDVTGKFAADGIDARATNWQGAAGSFGKFADIVRVVFIVAIVIIAIVAVIIMMNTLVVSVIERTGEIGTMRALGAQRGYVRKMFLAETLALTVFFGLVGSALALGLTALLNAIGIEAGSELVGLLFGGKVLHLVPRIGSFVSTLVMVFFVGFLAHLYPVSVALKIEPVRAMQNE